MGRTHGRKRGRGLLKDGHTGRTGSIFKLRNHRKEMVKVAKRKERFGRLKGKTHARGPNERNPKCVKQARDEK